MYKHIYKCLMLALTVVFLSGVLLPAGAAQNVDIMSKEALKKILANEDTYVLDVRKGRDWSSSEFKIEGAHRTDPGNFSTWASKFPKTGTLVLYCA